MLSSKPNSEIFRLEHEGKENEEAPRGRIEEVPEQRNRKFTCCEKVSQGSLYAIITYMLTMGPISIIEDEYNLQKTLVVTLALGVAAPWSMEYIKGMLNLSGALIKPFEINAKHSVIQSLIMAGLALIIYYCHVKNYLSPILYNTIILSLAIKLKLLSDFYCTLRFCPTQREGIRQPLLPIVALAHEKKWYNTLALHLGVRLPILFCAIVISDKILSNSLSTITSALGLTKLAGIISFSVMLNEIIGASLFWRSGWFQEAYPNYISRILTMIILPLFVQELFRSQTKNWLNIFLDVLMTVILDSAINLTIGPVIDKNVKHCTSYLLTRLGIFKPSLVANPETSNHTIII